jgi:hypothetical protein
MQVLLIFGTRFQASRSKRDGDHRFLVASVVQRPRKLGDRKASMTRKSLTFVFGLILAMATVLAITTWAATPKSNDNWAAAVPAKETIYRSDLWKVY